jgi:CRISPR/Cas system-associated exonuclease Cas4 (RecB family)
VEGDGEEKYELLKGLIFSLLKEIIDSDIPFKPAAERKKTCPDCSYKHICGAQWIVK